MTRTPCEDCEQKYKCRQAYLAYTGCEKYRYWYIAEWNIIRERTKRLLETAKSLREQGIEYEITHC